MKCVRQVGPTDGGSFLGKRCWSVTARTSCGVAVSQLTDPAEGMLSTFGCRLAPHCRLAVCSCSIAIMRDAFCLGARAGWVIKARVRHVVVMN